MEYNVNRYIEILTIENKKHNLVSRKSFEEEVYKHIEDSKAILQFALLENKNIVDIGSGAGFPALILAILTPTCKFTLVESDLKKSEFLIKVVEELKLTNVEVIRQRVEQLGQDELYRGKFDICTSRAVAPINVMLEYGLPLLKVRGKMWLWKGRNYKNEIKDAKNALSLLNGEVVSNHEYKLMLEEEKDRVIVVVEKLNDTPDKYPRRVGIPAKRPL